MLPVVEIFTSIQGEGKYTGAPSIFVRVSGCNLRCIFKDSICDTPYTSFTPEAKHYNSIDDLVLEFKKEQGKYPHVKHVVITGGEPLLYKKDLEEFLARVWDDSMVITIETNGTKPILNPLSGKFRIDLYSVSPKLSTSVGKENTKIVQGDQQYLITKEMVERHDRERLNYNNLVDIVTSANYQFKFVYSGPECVEEIKNIYIEMGKIVSNKDDQFYNFYMKHHPMHNTMLMPEGVDSEDLDNKSQEMVKVCMENNWRFSDRLHIRIWGDKRGV